MKECSSCPRSRKAVEGGAEESEEAEVAEDLGGRRDPSTRDARSGRLSSSDSRLLADFVAGVGANLQ